MSEECGKQQQDQHSRWVVFLYWLLSDNVSLHRVILNIVLSAWNDSSHCLTLSRLFCFPFLSKFATLKALSREVYLFFEIGTAQMLQKFSFFRFLYVFEIDVKNIEKKTAMKTFLANAVD